MKPAPHIDMHTGQHTLRATWLYSCVVCAHHVHQAPPFGCKRHTMVAISELPASSSHVSAIQCMLLVFFSLFWAVFGPIAYKTCMLFARNPHSRRFSIHLLSAIISISRAHLIILLQTQPAKAAGRGIRPVLPLFFMGSAKFRDRQPHADQEPPTLDELSPCSINRHLIISVTSPGEAAPPPEAPGE
jgi:hypothetical protein